MKAKHPKDFNTRLSNFHRTFTQQTVLKVVEQAQLFYFIILIVKISEVIIGYTGVAIWLQSCTPNKEQSNSIDAAVVRLLKAAAYCTIADR